jgi:hypothetical protein
MWLSNPTHQTAPWQRHGVNVAGTALVSIGSSIYTNPNLRMKLVKKTAGYRTKAASDATA